MTRLALFQGPTSTPGTPDPDANLAAIDKAAADAAAQGAQLLITPEMSITGYDIGAEKVRELAHRDYLTAVTETARRHGIHLVVGYPELDGEDVYNTVAVVGPEGTVASCRKSHLYGDVDKRAFSAGDTLPAQFEFDGLTCGLLICYDVEFPETVRAHADAGTKLLIVPTGLMAPFTLIPDVIVRARAYESQVYLAYVNRTGGEQDFTYVGHTSLIAPDGEVLVKAGEGEELLIADVSAQRWEESRSINTHLDDRRPDLYR